MTRSRAPKLLSFTTHLGTIWVNVSKYHEHYEYPDDVNTEFLTACDNLEKYPFHIPLDEKALAALSTVANSDINLTPYYLFNRKKPLNREIYSTFVRDSSLAMDMAERLGAVGALDFLNGYADDSYMRVLVDKILSVFAVCVVGADCLEDLTAESIHCVVDFFRADSGRIWRQEVLGTNPNVHQVLGNLIRGLAKLKNDASLLPKAVSRPLRGGPGTFSDLERSDEPLARELVGFLSEVWEASLIKPTKSKQAALDLNKWLSEAYPGSSLVQIMQIRERPRSFSNFLQGLSVTELKTIVGRVTIAKRLCEEFERLVLEANPSLELFPLISDAELKALKGQTTTKKRSSSSARPLPEKLFPIFKEILDEGEEGWPGRLFRGKYRVDGTLREMHNPVIPTIFRNLLDVPIRSSNVRRQDSGEGDLEEFDASTMSWKENTSPLKGYWHKREENSGKTTAARGFAAKIEDDEGGFIGINVNTNKNLIPYVIPWQHEPYLTRCWRLGRFQRQYNRVSKPLPPEDYLPKGELSKSSMKQYPEIFALCRMPPDPERPEGRLPTTGELDHAWQWLNYEAQLRFNARNPPEKHIKIVEMGANGQPRGAIYNTHGLRVKGLSDLYHSGAPIEVLSRFLAGHSTLVMTLYYLKFDPVNINKLFQRAAIRARSEAQQQLIENFKRFKLEEALNRTVAIDQSNIEIAVDSLSKLEYADVGIGFCPFDGTRCAEGGKALRKDGNKTVYQNIGQRNCLRCRFFVSGPAWIVPLQLYGTKLLALRKTAADREQELNEEYSRIEQAWKAGNLTEAEYHTSADVRQVELVKVRVEIGEFDEAILNAKILIEASLALIKSRPENAQGFDLIGSEETKVHLQEAEVFDVMSALVQASRFTPMLGDPQFENARNAALDKIAFEGGITPITFLANLSEADKRRSYDQYAHFLSSRTTSDQRRQLIAGNIGLRDLQLDTQLQRVISNAIEGSEVFPVGTDTLLLNDSREGV